ncbi:MAG: hypothetical protein R3F17_10015 [Planctomycetota bacterium]
MPGDGGLLDEEAAPSLAGLGDPCPTIRPTCSLLEDRFAALRGVLDAGLRLKGWFGQRAESTCRPWPVFASMPDGAAARASTRPSTNAGGCGAGFGPPDAPRPQDRGTFGPAHRALAGRARKAEVRAVLSDNVVHRRGGRPVLAVKAKSAGRVRGIVHDTSQSGESVFIEPREVIEVGNRLASAEADRGREVQRVLVELTRSLIERLDRIEGCVACLARIEWASIGASYARAVGGHCAMQPGDVGAGRGLVLRAARHPLLIDQASQGALDEVVPIDLRVGDTFDMLIVTGPNTGGKTLAMKTAGLFATLTHLGLPLPCAEGTTVPLYDCVLADIGDEQEIRQNLSTFASHLVRIRAALEGAGANTLVLLDELGGGTDPDEGAALGEAVLETLLKRAAPTLVSTHIGRLKEFAFRHKRVENACTEFDLATLAPRYSLLVGTPGESGALVIARRLGLPPAVVELGETRMQRRDSELLELMGDVRQARVEAENTRKSAEQELESARAKARQVEERAQEIERRSDQLEREAQRGLEERLRDGMRNIERARALLPQIKGEVAGRLEGVLDQLAADLSGATLTDRRAAFLQGLGKGSLVYLPRYRQRVMVHKVDREKRIVVCKLGSMKVQVAFDEVTPYESL